MSQTTKSQTMNLTQTVREQYGAVASGTLNNEHQGVRAVAEAFGYTPDELASLPAEANMGLSCGNPTAVAHLREGEVVVDLGSGGGLDVFLAAKKVGPAGRAIGIDMTPEMVERAKKAAEGYDNVEFHLAPIDAIPLPDASVDVVISNCVVNLAPDKSAVFREVARILKPGGRVAISDLALKQPLPEELAESVAAYVGCIAGALGVEEYERLLTAAGFAGVQVIDSNVDLNAYGKLEGQSSCCSPAMSESSGLPVVQEVMQETACCGTATSSAVHEGLGALLAKFDINAYVASVKVFAVKPA